MTQMLFDLLKKRDAWIIRLETVEFKLRTGLKDFRLSDKKDCFWNSLDRNEFIGFIATKNAPQNVSDSN